MTLMVSIPHSPSRMIEPLFCSQLQPQTRSRGLLAATPWTSSVPTPRIHPVPPWLQHLPQTCTSFLVLYQVAPLSPPLARALGLTLDTSLPHKPFSSITHPFSFLSHLPPTLFPQPCPIPALSLPTWVPALASPRLPASVFPSGPPSS